MRRLPTIDLIMNIAAEEATSTEYQTIEPEHLFMAILKLSEFPPEDAGRELQDDDLARLLQDELKSIKAILREASVDSKRLRRSLRKKMGNGGFPFQGGTIHRSSETKRLFDLAAALAAQMRSPVLNVSHLLVLILKKPTPRIAELLPSPEQGALSGNRERIADVVNENAHPEGAEASEKPVSLGELSETLRRLRDELRAKVFGQDHAIHAFVEGLFSAEVVGAADESRRKPKGLFVFAGPPGVGKTYLAECASEVLGRPFKRFDMSSFSDHQDTSSLIGMHPSYKGAHSGLLTDFVAKNPQGVLLFDEIEKAHLNVVQLFLQVLDAGRLEDKYTEKPVSFRDTIIIFTTNAGKVLYEDSNVTGVYSSSTSFHRQTILDALENEMDPRTGRPFFPQAICSRMATGYPLMFNRLGVNELEKVAGAEMSRIGALLEKQYSKKIECGELVPLCLVLREGVRTDARTVRSQSESFLKTEMFHLCNLYQPERLGQIMEATDRIVIDLDTNEKMPDDVRRLFDSQEKPRVLLMVDEKLGTFWKDSIPEVAWKVAIDEPDVHNILENEELDLILLDIFMGRGLGTPTMQASSPMTMYQFDHVPLAAKGIARGQEVLRNIHKKRPEIPCFLLAVSAETKRGPGLDEELLMACIRSGGAQGVVETDFVSSTGENWEAARLAFASRILEICGKVRREKKAVELGSEMKALAFDTAPSVSEKERTIRIRLRNLRLSRALAASDVSEVLQDIERPAVKFEDVYGADSAKGELEFIVKWLQDPRRYKAMGLRPPRGVLLYGHPGTGKTLLARALAGECNAAFLVASATNFVTIWQGSGPQNVRDLFSRARRYAPSIVFIDEIDAIGKTRSGSLGASASSEQTLNALLTEMDGFGSPAAKPIIVLAATNLVELLDGALRRRFDREIEVDKPDRSARSAYLRRRLQGHAFRQVSDAVVERLAGQSANMTVAELERVVELSGRMASNGDGIITDEIVEEAFEKMRLGDIKNVAAPESLLRTARHEAGHCIIGWLRGERPVQISIIARGNVGGFVEKEADEDKMVYTVEDLEGMIRQSMAGRAAETVYYGEKGGLTTGASSDLKSATHYAELMVREYGMGDGIGHVVIDPKRLGDGPLAIEVMRTTERIIKQQLDSAVQAINNNRPTMDRLVDALMDKNRLTREDLESVMSEIS